MPRTRASKFCLEVGVGTAGRSLSIQFKVLILSSLTFTMPSGVRETKRGQRKV
ncbi:hypothetical protein AMATHDRAFT_66564 [Amanita thiersii Skay4041]|uniref:Uncharacterized protein n=1 Tax=Amanita thiersii Skay4041 TaxID=703135 RepID=A0A2A9NJE4_9AGAR|nr:hypothetical protein AMATHDRAFT_66564 [Amanita thiersii Skay4041]